MIGPVCLAFLGLQLASPATAQDQADFAAANEMILAGDNRGAIALFEDLLARGITNEDVLFNLGHAYAHAGRLVDATVAYERALRLVPFDAAIAENLERVRQRLHPGDAPERIEQPVEVVEQLVARVPPRVARVGVVLGFSSFFLAWFLRRRSTARWLRRVLLAWLLLGLFSAAPLAAAVAGQEWVRLERRVVVLEDRQLEDGPDLRFRDLGRVRAGSRARLLDEEGAWAKIQTEEGLTGWVESKQLVRLEAPAGAR